MTHGEKIHILIVGGGLAGVAAAIALSRHGHRVTLLESGSEFTETGAGIQVPLNCSRILKDWGLIDEFRRLATEPQSIDLRSYRDGEILSKTALVTDSEDEGKHPHLVLQRGDFLRIFIQEARRLGAKLLVDSEVDHIDFDVPSIRTKSGTIITADLVIGADGERSFCRSFLLRRDDPPIRTGMLVFRFTIRSDVVRQHNGLRHLVDPSSATCWMGPASHAVCYELTHRNLLNIVLIRPAEGASSGAGLAPRIADLSELRLFFSSWDPTLRTLLDLAESCNCWPLVKFQATSTWTHPSGKFLLIGDAAHCMQPHLVQGASQAIEDAACLGVLLSKLQSKAQISDILSIFCDLRKPRVSEIALKSERAGHIWQFGDGPLQVERDRQMRLNKYFPGFPNPFSDPSMLRLLYEYNVADDAMAALTRYERGEWPGTTGMGRDFGSTMENLGAAKRKIDEALL